jgi:hypothetical protein
VNAGWLAHYHYDKGCYRKFRDLLKLVHQQAQGINAVPVASPNGDRPTARRTRTAWTSG